MLTPDQIQEAELKLPLLQAQLRIPSICDFQEDISIQLKIDDCCIIFSKKASEGLSVSMETHDFFLTTLNPALYELFYQLYANPIVMKTFHYGLPKNQSAVDQYIAFWRIAEKKLSPFTAFAVFKKEYSSSQKARTFIGNISPDHRGDDPGLGELTYLILPEYWGKGYGKQLTDLILNYFLPAAILVGCNLMLREEKFKGVIATARTDNPASEKILLRFMNFIPNSEVEKYGAIRRTYSVPVQELMWQCLQHSVELIFIKRTSSLASPINQNEHSLSNSMEKKTDTASTHDDVSLQEYSSLVK